MKVAIIASPYPLEEAPAPPLGVTYVAAAFEAAGAEVKIWDYIVNRYTPEKLKAQLDAFQPDAVGATSVTLNFPPAAEIVQTVKRYNPAIVTMMGGPHVSFDADETLKNYPGIDLIVRGEGEKTIADLTPVLRDPSAWEGIKGISFRRNGEIVHNAPQDLIEDLDTLPLPSRHLLPLSRYMALGYPISIITGRGCPYACIFCQGRRMVGKKPRQRSSQLVVEEIEHIMSYGITRINVADDLFTANKQKVREVCDEIHKRNLKLGWSAFARVNTVDKETLEIMRDAGCDAVSFGIESGNPEMLKRIKKGITLDMARAAISLCKEVGILAHTSFMVGLPGETPETLQDTKEFAADLGRRGALYGYHFLAPFPGTTVHDELEKYDLEILTGDWTKYDANSAIVRTSQLSPEEIERFVAAYDAEIDEGWQKQVRGYREGTNPPEEDMKVEGYFRTLFVYRLLSEDLIEKCGTFMGNAIVEDTIKELCRRIAGLAADTEAKLIEKTIRDFIAKGYVKTKKEGGTLVWYWTHNNKVDQLQ
ncbi:MAG: radical SAM protein [Smithellaceae bacterium]|nr:radical SAM protein [Smithellaceae bacterium]